MWDILAIVVALLLFVALGYLYYSGLFYPIVIKIDQPYEGTLSIAYKYNIGNYNSCGKVFGEFVSATSPGTDLIGIYYDNPDDPKVDKDRCRYIVGAVLNSKSEKHRETLMSRGYSFTTVPALGKGIFVDFPMVNRLSIYIAVYRIYSAMFAYMKKQQLMHTGCMVELYGDKKMRVIAPLEENSGFFVPELKR